MDDLLVVGIGASAGGVNALKQFFGRVRRNSGIAYVTLLHLSPEDENHLSEVLQSSSSIPVLQVRGPVRLEADHAYVIAPNQRLSLREGFLEVAPLTRAEERRAPVDLFFETLAAARGSRAVGVVLTGTGADGSRGVEAIKEHGGVCYVQDPVEAEHDDMPRHAVATGLVDGVWPGTEIPSRVASYYESVAQRGESVAKTSGGATLQREDAAGQRGTDGKRTKNHLHAAVEQYEAQSDKLEASTEGVRAMNEELTTLNQELKARLDTQTQAHYDLENLIECTGIAAIVLDRSSRVKLFTRPAREVFHLVSSDVGRPLSEINSQLAYDEVQADIERVLGELIPVERELRHPDGGIYWARLVPYRTAEGRNGGVVATFVEITDRRRYEAKLRRREDHLRLVLESITEHAILTLDAAGTIVEWNIGAERVFGFTAADAIGQPTEIIFTPEDLARGAHIQEMRVARTQGRAADERWHMRKDGSRVFVSGVLSPLGRDRSSGFVKVARDLTQRKQQEEELRRAYDLLESRVRERTIELASELHERRQTEERVRKLLSRLISVQEDERRRIARDLHDDLGQKMTALHLKLEALRRATSATPAAHEQAKSAQAFVQQLDRDLDFFTWELRPAALYDLGLAQALRDFVEQWSKNYGIESDFEAIGVDKERWRPEVEINLYRIAQEALNNVYKHARATCVDVVLQRRDNELVLSIEDNGIGLDARLAADPGGRGMGLIGMRERTTLIGGTIEVERAESGGTTVIVRAPAAAREEPPSHPGDATH